MSSAVMSSASISRTNATVAALQPGGTLPMPEVRRAVLIEIVGSSAWCCARWRACCGRSATPDLNVRVDRPQREGGARQGQVIVDVLAGPAPGAVQPACSDASRTSVRLRTPNAAQP